MPIDRVSETNPTGYSNGCLTILTRHEEVIYFAARSLGGKVYSGPEHWIGTLFSSNILVDQLGHRILCAGAALRWAETSLNRDTGYSQNQVCLVDEEFFLSYGGEMPEGWPA